MSSYLYAKAGCDVEAVQDLMAHTDPEMTRAFQKGHARKVVLVEMMLTWSIGDEGIGDAVREPRPRYEVSRAA